MGVHRLGDRAPHARADLGPDRVTLECAAVDDRSSWHDRGMDAGTAPKSLPLILARELAANLATPMFIIDATGVLVFYNEAAELLIGRSFGELGEVAATDFGAVLELSEAGGTPLRRRDTPAGVAFFDRRPSHRMLVATGYDGIRRKVEVTAYPLFGTTNDMHGVVTVFWEVH